MTNNPVPENDPTEIEHSQLVYRLLRRAASIAEVLENMPAPELGSKLDQDDQRVPTRRVSNYAHSQLVVATGCLESLEHMISRESEDEVSLAIAPYGYFALIRNAIDCLASALWLMEPVNGTLRIKRLLMLHLDEVMKASSFRASAGIEHREYKRTHFARLQEIASEAELGSWSLRKSPLPSMTKTLKQIERLHGAARFSWLALWQLASGHAHGKNWATLSSHMLEQIPGSEHEYGATFRVTGNYSVLAYFLLEVVKMLELSVRRYQELSHG
ncbi:hypothetical protein [Glutamicibacter sp. 2E12]|uniref:hypothetical protein n=1 Tax=Glutamicibacter sp. 2E12 TaxID=3416181 RepID=UPI003CF72298